MLQNSTSPTFLRISTTIRRETSFSKQHSSKCAKKVNYFEGIHPWSSPSTVAKPLALPQFWSLQRGVKLWQVYFLHLYCSNHMPSNKAYCITLMDTQRPTALISQRCVYNCHGELESIGYIIGHVTSARWLVRPDESARWRKPPSSGWCQYNFPYYYYITSKLLTSKMWLPFEMVCLY